MAGELSKILDFLIPIIVWALLIYVIYRVPIVKEGIDKLRNWWSNRREKDTEPETSTLRSINYE